MRRVMPQTLALPVPETTTQRSLPLPEATWSFPRRLAFRFAVVYLVLYNFDVAVRLAFGTDVLSALTDRLWDALVPWAGARFLHLSVPAAAPNGSGDRLFDYVQVFCFAGLSWIASLVWSMVDHRRSDYRVLLRWLRVYVRYSLGVTLLSYGAFKVFKSQFPAPTPFRLTQSFGDASPMGLLWTFMGYSTAYTIFAGAAEVLAGLLLFFRRTAALGAVVAVVVMINVVVLNFCYDVPVKLYSSHLLAMSIFLLLPSLGRLADVLVRERPTLAEPVIPLVSHPRLATAGRLLGLVFVGAAVVKTGGDAWQARKGWGDGVPPPRVHGAYQVEELTIDPRLRTSALAATRWRRVGLDSRGFQVLLGDDSVLSLKLVSDQDGRLVLADPAAGNRQYQLRYRLGEGDQQLFLEGGVREETVAVRLRRLSAADFPLARRRFHWVSEAPYNR
jgi:uncharacterized membrane protein YphA (DoxX/SURF4 family)